MSLHEIRLSVRPSIDQISGGGRNAPDTPSTLLIVLATDNERYTH